MVQRKRPGLRSFGVGPLCHYGVQVCLKSPPSRVKDFRYTRRPIRYGKSTVTLDGGRPWPASTRALTLGLKRHRIFFGKSPVRATESRH